MQEKKDADPPSPLDLYGYPEKAKYAESVDTNKTAKGEISDFLDYTTTHGIPHLKRAEHWTIKVKTNKK